MAFKTICVDHVGIACAGTLEEAAKIYTEVLGLKATGTEEVKEQGVAIRTLFPAAQTLIELLVDITETTMVLSANTLLKTALASNIWLCALTTSKQLSLT